MKYGYIFFLIIRLLCLSVYLDQFRFVGWFGCGFFSSLTWTGNVILWNLSQVNYCSVSSGTVSGTVYFQGGIFQKFNHAGFLLTSIVH